MRRCVPDAATHDRMHHSVNSPDGSHVRPVGRDGQRVRRAADVLRLLGVPATDRAVDGAHAVAGGLFAADAGATDAVDVPVAAGLVAAAESVVAAGHSSAAVAAVAVGAPVAAVELGVAAPVAAGSVVAGGNSLSVDVVDAQDAAVDPAAAEEGSSAAAGVQAAAELDAVDVQGAAELGAAAAPDVAEPDVVDVLDAAGLGAAAAPDAAEPDVVDAPVVVEPAAGAAAPDAVDAPASVEPGVADAPVLHRLLCFAPRVPAHVEQLVRAALREPYLN